MTRCCLVDNFLLLRISCFSQTIALVFVVQISFDLAIGISFPTRYILQFQ